MKFFEIRQLLLTTFPKIRRSTSFHMQYRNSLMLNLIRFDASWEAMGCHTSIIEDTKLVRCTCEQDYCNGNVPVTDYALYDASASASVKCSQLYPHLVSTLICLLYVI